MKIWRIRKSGRELYFPGIVAVLFAVLLFLRFVPAAARFADQHMGVSSLALLSSLFGALPGTYLSLILLSAFYGWPSEREKVLNRFWLKQRLLMLVCAAFFFVFGWTNPDNVVLFHMGGLFAKACVTLALALSSLPLFLIGFHPGQWWLAGKHRPAGHSPGSGKTQ